MVEVELYDDTAVPYAPKPYEEPEVDLELPAHGVGSIIPDWQKKDEEEKTK